MKSERITNIPLFKGACGAALSAAASGGNKNRLSRHYSESNQVHAQRFGAPDIRNLCLL